MERDDWNAMWSGQGEHGHDHDHHHHGEGEDRPHHGEGPDALLVEVAAPLAPGRALDLGCGLGGNAIWLAQRGWQVRAVDFADVALGTARERAGGAGVEVDFVVGDLREYRGEQTYDLVTLFYIHLSGAERRDLLHRAAALLAPGGRLLFVGHDRSDVDKIDLFLAHSLGDTEPTDADRAEVAAMLSVPAEVAADLEGLVIQRSQVVEGHGHGSPAPTTLVLATRPETVP